MSLDMLFQAIATKFTADRSDRIMKAERIKELAEEYASATDDAILDEYRMACDLPPKSSRPIGDIALALWEAVRSLPEIEDLEGESITTRTEPAVRAPTPVPVPVPVPRPAPPKPSPPAPVRVVPARDGLDFIVVRATGKPVLLYGGTPEPAKERFLVDSCGSAVWIGGNRDPATVAERVQNGAYSVVLIASGLISHGAVKRLVEAAKAARVPFESVEKGGQGSLVKALTSINARMSVP